MGVKTCRRSTLGPAGTGVLALAMFTWDADHQRADWQLLQNGAVSLFWQPSVLDDAQQALAALGYEIAEISCEAGRFKAEMSRALKWQEQFGYSPWTGNLDALNDGLRHVPFGPSGRMALTLRRFHELVAVDADFAWKVIDLIEYNARDLLLEGKLLIGLVQTDDNLYACPPLGGRSVRWNGQEWLDKDRGL